MTAADCRDSSESCSRDWVDDDDDDGWLCVAGPGSMELTQGAAGDKLCSRGSPTPLGTCCPLMLPSHADTA
jgi:hypothetical protein